MYGEVGKVLREMPLLNGAEGQSARLVVGESGTGFVVDGEALSSRALLVPAFAQLFEKFGIEGGGKELEVEVPLATVQYFPEEPEEIKVFADYEDGAGASEDSSTSEYPTDNILAVVSIEEVKKIS